MLGAACRKASQQSEKGVSARQLPLYNLQGRVSTTTHSLGSSPLGNQGVTDRESMPGRITANAAKGRCACLRVCLSVCMCVRRDCTSPVLFSLATDKPYLSLQLIPSPLSSFLSLLSRTLFLYLCEFFWDETAKVLQDFPKGDRQPTDESLCTRQNFLAWDKKENERRRQ